MTERLTTLPIVKEWLGITSDDSDSELVRIIEAASRFVLNYLNLDALAPREFIQNFKGNGKDTMLLKSWPIIAVTSVGIYGKIIPQGSRGVGGMPSSGWYIGEDRSAPQSVDLYQHRFILNAPCQIIYTAGYQSQQLVTLELSGEAPNQVVTASTNVGGQWIKDISVHLDGVLASRVDADPAPGEYAVSEWGIYSFNVSDAGKVAVIIFAYAPNDLSQGVVEIIGEWFARKDRIGVRSKSLSGGVGESVTFLDNDMNASVRASLQPYRNVIPT